ncbi:tRNA synthetases class I (E and Q), catalytic domain protein, partial [Chlamydia psittaci C1/97]
APTAPIGSQNVLKSIENMLNSF